MIDRQKLILMSKLAVYDKHFADSDKKVNECYRSDYIYRKNAWTRFYVFIGSLIVLCVYWLHKIVVDKVDIYSLDFMQELWKNAFFVIAMLCIYSLIGWVREVSCYNACMKRLKHYFAMLSQLDRLSGRTQFKEASENGAGAFDTRDYS